MNWVLNAAVGGAQNLLQNKKGCSYTDFIRTLLELAHLVKELQSTTPVDIPQVVHKRLAPLLGDNTLAEVHEDDLGNHLLPFAEILALHIQLFTPYEIELSSFVDSKEYLEFAFGSFDASVTVPWSNVNDQAQVTGKLSTMGADDLSAAWLNAQSLFPAASCVSS